MQNNEKPLVSVIIPCYNHENFVQDCIQSVIDQTYENIELIIIDDGSKDNSVHKIQEMTSLCDERFVQFEFRHRPNKGLCNTLNEALEWCQGEYYSVIASDDIMLKNKTAIQVEFLNKNKSVLAVFGGIKLIDENNRELSERLSQSEIYDFRKIIMHEHDLPAPTQMIRLNALREVGGYNPNILIEDWYMWLKLSSIGNLYYMNELLCLYRQHDNNISKNIIKMNQGRIDVLSNFKNSLYYDKALENIKWISASEWLRVNLFVALFNYLNILIKHPQFFLATFSNRVIKKIKGF